MNSPQLLSLDRFDKETGEDIMENQASSGTKLDESPTNAFIPARKHPIVCRMKVIRAVTTIRTSLTENYVYLWKGIRIC
eukprot:gene8758-1141_t